MPSGRDIHSTKRYVPPSLDEDTLARMRAPPEKVHSGKAIEDDSSSDSEEEVGKQSNLSQALPGSFTKDSNDDAYF